MEGSVGYGSLNLGVRKEIGRYFGKLVSEMVLNWIWKGFQIGLEILKNGSFSEGIDSCLGRIDSHDSELKENVILGPQSRFSHCPNRFRVSQRARALLQR
ncbi:hypothetical protein PIB30_084650, partial [Stylosanthes scabra]|nr:hypothetical protein [Stylosanthes scabra]